MNKLVGATVAFALVVLTLTGMVWAASAAYDDAGEETTTVTNESITADVGNWTEVNAPDYALEFKDDETVYNSSDVELVENTDYEWNTTNGSVKFLNTQNVSDGESMRITYNYTAKVPVARTIKGSTTLLFPALAMLTLLSVGMVAVAIGADLSGLFGRNGGGGVIGR